MKTLSQIDLIPYHDDYYEQAVALVSDLQVYFSDIDKYGENQPFRSKADAVSYFDQILKDVKEMSGIVYLAINNGDVVGLIQGVVVTHEKTPYTDCHIRKRPKVGLDYCIFNQSLGSNTLPQI